MNPANYREALIETRLDEAEGADILMVRYVSCLPKSEFPKAVPCARFTSRIGKCGCFTYFTPYGFLDL